MADSLAPEYVRFVADQRKAQRASATVPTLREGETQRPLQVSPKLAGPLLRVAARRAAGLFRPGRQTEVLWVEGDSELAVSLVGIEAKLGDGLIEIALPVRCDQTGNEKAVITFACGSPDAPAGLYAAVQRRPRGPELIVASWGDALTAFAWQCVLGLVTGVAAAAGKDTRGNLLVPVEMEVSARGIAITPMARHRFSGSSGLKATTMTRGVQS